ncbi:hypothetical protein EJB05_45033, partial [Eragrostis curvula]
MDDSHDGGDSRTSLLLRPFSWKHKQGPADSALLVDLNQIMRSSHDRGLMMAPAAHGGEGKPTDGSKPTGLRVKTKVRSCYSMEMRVPDKTQHRQPLFALERIDEAAASEEEDEGNAHASEAKKPNDAVRAPPTPPATAEPGDERKAAVKVHPPPQQPVPSMAKVNAGYQESGPSGQKPVRSNHHDHHRRAPESAGIRDDEEEEALRLGERAVMAMDDETRKSEAYRWFVARQRRDADRPPFNFRLPDELAEADVREVMARQPDVKWAVHKADVHGPRLQLGQTVHLPSKAWQPELNARSPPPPPPPPFPRRAWRQSPPPPRPTTTTSPSRSSRRRGSPSSPANPSAQHDPVDPDRYPYVLAASAFCVLVNFSVLPFYGVQFGDHPHDPHLVLVRDREFHHPEAGVCTATAQRLPSRHGSLPIIYNLESIGLVTRLRVGANEEHVVAELFVDKGSESASIAYWSAELYDWQHKEGIVYPLAAHRDRDWVPSGVVSHDEKTWWLDLSWGILSSDFSHLPNLTLLFHDLPVGRALDASQPDIRHRRCITESGNALRYVEIISDGDASATVCLWTGIPVPNDDGRGILVGFEEIWDDDTYKATGLPHKVPVLTAVCPTNPALVYFCLEQEQRLFGVDVPLHTVVQFVDEAYDLVMPWPAPLCSRYVLPWLLPPQVLQALGIDPFMDEPPGAIKSRKDTPRSTESGDDTIGSEEPGDNATGSDESGTTQLGPMSQRTTQQDPKSQRTTQLSPKS